MVGDEVYRWWNSFWKTGEWYLHVVMVRIGDEIVFEEFANKVFM